MTPAQRFALSTLLTLVTSTAAWAQTPTQAQAPAQAAGEQSRPMLQYPELQVTPSASARLDMEMKREKASNWTEHLPLQVSAVTTIAASAMLMSEDKDQMSGDKKDQAKYAATTGFVVGAAWLGLSAYLTSSYHPYADGNRLVSTLPSANRKDALVRERMAEEVLDRSASFSRRITWLSVATNVLASGFVLASSDSKGTQAIAGLAAVAAFAPVIFPYDSIYAANQHQLYKKRIYAPIVGPGLQSSNGDMVPSMFAHLSF